MKKFLINNLNGVQIANGRWLNERQCDINDMNDKYISYGITHDGRMLNLYENVTKKPIGYGIINNNTKQILIYDPNNKHISTAQQF
jgi:hypothetical protein